MRRPYPSAQRLPAAAVLAAVGLATIRGCCALNNGLGATPVMGYNTWYTCSSFRDNGPGGWCWDSEAHVRNVSQYFLSSGLAALGYTYINIDEGVRE